MALAYLTKLRGRSELANPRVDQPTDDGRNVTATDDQRSGTLTEADQRKALADQVILAGKKRRGEITDDEPETEVVKALKASRRARGVPE